jgi:8-oxo-dGTP pyrophosphatase MutT (NUDIX family)
VREDWLIAFRWQTYYLKSRCSMSISPYIKKLREKIGCELLLLPSVTAIILDESGRVLLHRASDDGRWYTIGGAMDPGEEPADAVVREALEETGLQVVAERVTGVQTSPVVTYPNGDQVQYVAIAFICRVVGGTLAMSDESLELRYFGLDELPELPADQAQRVRYSLSGQAGSFFQSNALAR